MQVFRALVGSLGIVAPVCILGSCQQLPAPKVSREAVLQATREVIAQRYPMHAISEEGGYVVALGPVKMEGNTRTRRQISVRVQQNYTGSYDPDVVVRLQGVKDRTPYFETNPESPSPADAKPIAANEWQPLDRLPNEEQEIYDEILRRLEPRGL